MPARPSPSLRYLKARLRVLLKRPMMWGSGLVVFLAVGFLLESWTTPQSFLGLLPAEWLFSGGEVVNDPSSSDPAPEPMLEPAADVSDVIGSTLPSPEATDGLTSLDASRSAIVTDPKLDPLLAQPLLGLPSSSQSDSSSDSSSDRRSRRNVFSRSRSSLTSKPDLSLSDPDTPSFLGRLDSEQATSPMPLGSSPATSTSSAASATSPSAINPLQSALERSSSTGQPASLPHSMTTSGAPGSSSSQVPGVSGPSSAPSGLPAAPAEWTQSMPGQPPSYFPQTSPNPGTTGYTMPPAFRTPANTPSQFGTYSGSSSGITPPTSIAPAGPTAPSLAPAVPQPSFGSYSTPSSSTAAPTPDFSGVQSPQAAPTAPFSVPRTPPGRTIGGGEINTFSNP
ncbi:MAG: hypothetical protein IGS38_15655 [Synechococcales cyanobacterium M58_A2018_015]|nr:hypothetical protein [Synechococcales cyanobacterium M58_A2018_015]